MRLLLSSLIAFLAIPAFAATYYVSPSGNDANDGRSPATSWKTIARVMSASLAAGDTLLFEGGQTFAGSLTFTQSITVASYGNGRATIASGREHAIGIGNASGIVVKSLRLRGDAANSGASGVGVFSGNGATIRTFHLHDVEISGYTNGFVAIIGTTTSKIHDIRIEHCALHDNAIGAAFYGNIERPAAAHDFDYAIAGVVITDSLFYRNKGGGLFGGYGAGIFMINADDVAIRRNLVADNGGDNPEVSPNGPSAITVYDGRRVVIEENEIRGQRYDVQNQTDNGGIDIWALDSLVQYNYIHDNEGWGLILGGADPELGLPLANWPSRNNTFRYNILENNARRLPDSEATVVFFGAQILMFGQLENFDIYNNTIIARGPAPGVPADAEQGMVYLIDVPGTGSGWSDLRFRNNVFVADGDVTLLEIPRPTAGTGLLFENNAYLTTGATEPVVWGESTFTTIAAWSQDPRARVGSTAMLCGFKPRANASLIDSGLQLPNAGTRDHRGRPIPAGGGFDIGAIELQPGESCGKRPSARH